MSVSYKSLRKLGDKEIVERVLSDFRYAQKEKGEAIERCKRYLKIYEATDNPEDIIDEETGQLSDDRRIYSDTYLPLGAAIVDTAASAIYNSFFSVPDYFDIESSDPYDTMTAPRIVAHLQKRHKETKFRSKVYRAIQQCLIYDYVVTMVGWELQGGFVPKRKVKTETVKVGRLTQKSRKVDIEMEWVPDAVDRSNVWIFDFFNCYHDPRAMDDFNDSQFFIDCRDVTIEELESNPMRYAPETVAAVAKAVDKEMPIKTGQSASDPTKISYVKQRGKAYVVRYWTKDMVVELCGDILLSKIEITGYPLQVWYIHPNPKGFGGIGILQRMERPQYDINAIVNAKRDFQNLVLNPIAVIDEEMMTLNNNNIDLFPGRTLIGPAGRNQKELIYFFQPGIDTSQGASEEMSLQMEIIQMVSGLPQNMMSQYSPGRKTARETSSVMGAAIGKVMTVAENLEDRCLESIYELQFKLEQMLLTKKESVRYHGQYSDQWLTISPEDYRWSSLPKFVPKGTTVVRDKEVLVQQFLSAMDRSMTMPEFFDWAEIFREMWKMLVPKDYQRFVLPNPNNYENIPPALEEEAMAKGYIVKVSPANDDATHLQSHSRRAALPEFKAWPPAAQAEFMQHIEAHKKQAQGKQQQKMQVLSRQAQPTGQDSSDMFRGLRGAEVPTGA